MFRLWGFKGTGEWNWEKIGEPETGGRAKISVGGGMFFVEAIME
jgi:hypothetical protein